MSTIERLKLKNFKRFKDFDIFFDQKINILIGDNQAGKSTVLTAIDFVISGSRNKIEAYGLENLFNVDIVNDFLSQREKKYENLPNIEIEIFLSEQNNPDVNGRNNSEKKDCDGLKLVIKPNDDYSKQISEIINDEKCNFPFEFYMIDFKTFSDQSYGGYNKYLNHILVDNSQVSSEYALREYIRDIYSSNLADSVERYHLQHQYRILKDSFKDSAFDEINKRISGVKFSIRTSHKSNLETDLAILEDNINIENKGKGKLCFVKTELALNKAGKNLGIVLLEEPENHLSHLNMKKLINKIISANDKQLFIATHSNLISSRLDLRHVILINSSSTSSLKLKELSIDTANFFIKAPDKNILEFILSKKSILVEGDAEYILMEAFYRKIHGHDPHVDEVSIISVDGKTFKRYLEIAKILNIKVSVLTDNDKNYNQNIYENYKNYLSNNVKIYSDKDDERYTFEVCVYNDNTLHCDELFSKGRVKLSPLEFMLKNKAEAALKILESDLTDFIIPSYIDEAITWIKD